VDINWKSPFVTRIAILAVCILAFGFFLFERSSYIVALVLLAACLFQVKQLLDLIDKPSPVIGSLFRQIHFDELTAVFKTDSTDADTKQLEQQLNDALGKIRSSRQEKDTEYLFYKNIVMHVGIGLIIFRERDGKIEIFNSAARKLLRVNKAETLEGLKEVNETLVNAFTRLKTGGRELIRLQIGEDFIQLSVYAIELTLRGETLKLISLQNIQSELEEKEMEAWQNLVRVLTHEIMNSVTPISSLAGTLEDELNSHLKNQKDKPLNAEQLSDVQLSLQTISKRSANLIHFVKEFRSLTHIPKPKPQSVPVLSLLEELAVLYKKEVTEKQITMQVTVEPTDLTIMADKGLIEQVLINLIKNAIQAFEDQPDKQIVLRAYCNQKLRPVISVSDNGTGIDPEALEKIFIPFFTTKKTGSGIGLSLSRQIMRQHQGTLTVKSTPGRGTEFIMRF
jgi:two-component system nitrogen regulation sensor histidine kinase NtrY